MNFQVKSITNNLATEYVVKYHYLHKVPNRKFSYGLFDGEKLIGVCIFGICPYENVVDRIVGIENRKRTLELTRVWVSDEYSIKNIESYFIGKCLKLLKDYVIISYADPHAGHRGIIYQACNFKYYGLSTGGSLKYEKNFITTTYHRKHLYVYDRFNCVKLTQKPYPKKDCLIYALVDPDSDEVRYIGLSSTGLDRPNEHKKKSNLRGFSHKINWIKSLIERNKMYKIKVIEYVEPEELNSREMYWIAKYRKHGYNLTNATIGGEGTIGFKFSEESKQKISKARLEYYTKHPEQAKKLALSQRKPIQYIDEIPHFECSKCKKIKPLSEFSRNKSRWNGHESFCKECDKIRQKRKKKNKLSPEEFQKSYETRKEKIREGVLTAYRNNPELREKISKACKKPIIARSIAGNEILRFDSATEAKGFNSTNIGVAIRTKKPYRGYYWEFDKKN
jgi:hypothetical protein